MPLFTFAFDKLLKWKLRISTSVVTSLLKSPLTCRLTTKRLRLTLVQHFWNIGPPLP